MRSGAMWLGGLAVLAVTAAAPVAAQGAKADSVVATAVRREWLVRISVDQGRLIGVLSRPAGGAVELSSAIERRTIPIAAIDSLWARGNAAKTGAIVGGIAGGLSGAFLGWIVAVVCDAADCPSRGSKVLEVGLAGIPAGMLIGAGIGALFPRWHRKFP